MRLPQWLRREPTHADSLKVLQNMSVADQERLFDMTKSLNFGENFLSAVRTASKSEKKSFYKLSPHEQLDTIRTTAVVHACVTTIASAFQEAPLTIEEREPDGTWKKTDAIIPPYIGPFKSNPDLSESEIAQYSVMNLELTGKSFLWLVRNGMGEVVEVWPLPVSCWRRSESIARCAARCGALLACRCPAFRFYWPVM